MGFTVEAGDILFGNLKAPDHRLYNFVIPFPVRNQASRSGNSQYGLDRSRMPLKRIGPVKIILSILN